MSPSVVFEPNGGFRLPEKFDLPTKVYHEHSQWLSNSDVNDSRAEGDILPSSRLQTSNSNPVPLPFAPASMAAAHEHTAHYNPQAATFMSRTVSNSALNFNASEFVPQGHCINGYIEFGGQPRGRYSDPALNQIAAEEISSRYAASASKPDAIEFIPRQHVASLLNPQADDFCPSPQSSSSSNPEADEFFFSLVESLSLNPEADEFYPSSATSPSLSPTAAEFILGTKKLPLNLEGCAYVPSRSGSPTSEPLLIEFAHEDKKQASSPPEYDSVRQVPSFSLVEDAVVVMPPRPSQSAPTPQTLSVTAPADSLSPTPPRDELFDAPDGLMHMGPWPIRCGWAVREANYDWFFHRFFDLSGTEWVEVEWHGTGSNSDPPLGEDDEIQQEASFTTIALEDLPVKPVFGSFVDEAVQEPLEEIDEPLREPVQISDDAGVAENLGEQVSRLVSEPVEVVHETANVVDESVDAVDEQIEGGNAPIEAVNEAAQPDKALPVLDPVSMEILAQARASLTLELPETTRLTPAVEASKELVIRYDVAPERTEQMRQDWVASNYSSPGTDSTFVHHFNFFGHTVFCKSYTPPSTSLAIILGTAKFQDIHNVNNCNFHKAVLLWNAVLYLDPVIFRGDISILDLKGTKLENASVGLADKVYTGVGRWLNDYYGQDEDFPEWDPLNTAPHEAGEVILNGITPNKGMPLRIDHILTVNMKEESVQQMLEDAIKQRKFRGPVKSMLSIAETVKHEIDAPLEAITSQNVTHEEATHEEASTRVADVNASSPEPNPRNDDLTTILKDVVPFNDTTRPFVPSCVIEPLAISKKSGLSSSGSTSASLAGEDRQAVADDTRPETTDSNEAITDSSLSSWSGEHAQTFTSTLPFRPPPGTKFGQEYNAALADAAMRVVKGLIPQSEGQYGARVGRLSNSPEREKSSSQSPKKAKKSNNLNNKLLSPKKLARRKDMFSPQCLSPLREVTSVDEATEVVNNYVFYKSPRETIHGVGDLRVSNAVPSEHNLHTNPDTSASVKDSNNKFQERLAEAKARRALKADLTASADTSRRPPRKQASLSPVPFRPATPPPASGFVVGNSKDPFRPALLVHSPVPSPYKQLDLKHSKRMSRSQNRGLLNTIHEKTDESGDDVSPTEDVDGDLMPMPLTPVRKLRTGEVRPMTPIEAGGSSPIAESTKGETSNPASDGRNTQLRASDGSTAEARQQEGAGAAIERSLDASAKPAISTSPKKFFTERNPFSKWFKKQIYSYKYAKTPMLEHDASLKFTKRTALLLRTPSTSTTTNTLGLGTFSSSPVSAVSRMRQLAANCPPGQCPELEFFSEVCPATLPPGGVAGPSRGFITGTLCTPSIRSTFDRASAQEGREWSPAASTDGLIEGDGHIEDEDDTEAPAGNTAEVVFRRNRPRKQSRISGMIRGGVENKLQKKQHSSCMTTAASAAPGGENTTTTDVQPALDHRQPRQKGFFSRMKKMLALRAQE